MRLALLALGLLGLAACEHDEHPFEIGWSVTCAAEGAPPLSAAFSKDFWEDDQGRRREYVGELRAHLDAEELWDSYRWLVAVDLREGTAESVELVHTPIPDDFADAFGLEPLSVTLQTYEEDPEGSWAQMTGTCAWGGATGALTMRQSDDCDACLECSTLGLIPPGLVALIPVWLGLAARRRRRQ
jgi:hypothetical protein